MFAIEIETYQQCGGRLRVIASIEAPRSSRRFLSTSVATSSPSILIDLTLAVVAINGWNRIAISFGETGSSRAGYRPWHRDARFTIAGLKPAIRVLEPRQVLDREPGFLAGVSRTTWYRKAGWRSAGMTPPTTPRQQEHTASVIMAITRLIDAESLMRSG